MCTDTQKNLSFFSTNTNLKGHVYKLTHAGTEDEEEGPKSKKTFRSQSVVAQNPEAELMLEGDDDAVSLLQEKEIDNLAGETQRLKSTYKYKIFLCRA